MRAARNGRSVYCSPALVATPGRKYRSTRQSTEKKSVGVLYLWPFGGDARLIVWPRARVARRASHGFHHAHGYKAPATRWIVLRGKSGTEAVENAGNTRPQHSPMRGDALAAGQFVS
ncbi:hypothetical protein MRX96_004733 [Rhipicephalus microplus]